MAKFIKLSVLEIRNIAGRDVDSRPFTAILNTDHITMVRPCLEDPGSMVFVDAPTTLKATEQFYATHDEEDDEFCDLTPAAFTASALYVKESVDEIYAMIQA